MSIKPTACLLRRQAQVKPAYTGFGPPPPDKVEPESFGDAALGPGHAEWLILILRIGIAAND